MKFCNIIRSIVVALVILVLLTLTLFDFQSIWNVKSALSVYIKFVYLAVYVSAIVFYNLIKKRLNKKIKNSNIIYLYRYLYIGVVVFVSRMLMVYGIKSNEVVDGTMYGIICATILTYINAILIKRIIFNITSSELLSGISAITYIFIPQALINSINYTKYGITLTLLLLSLYTFLIIIDEIGQKRLKSKKYIYLSILEGIILISLIIFKGSYIYPFLIIIMFILTISKSDFTHFSFGKKFEKLPKKYKDIIYKIERLVIPKKVIVFLIQVVATLVGILIVNMFNNNEVYIISDIPNRIKEFLSITRYWYLLLFIAILILDILSVVLRRELEVKLSIINGSFVLVSILTMIMYNGSYFNSIFDAMLVLKLMLSIGNIYLNREEKIKLLKAKN